MANGRDNSLILYDDESIKMDNFKNYFSRFRNIPKIFFFQTCIRYESDNVEDIFIDMTNTEHIIAIYATSNGMFF